MYFTPGMAGIQAMELGQVDLAPNILFRCYKPHGKSVTMQEARLKRFVQEDEFFKYRGSSWKFLQADNNDINGTEEFLCMAATNFGFAGQGYRYDDGSSDTASRTYFDLMKSDYEMISDLTQLDVGEIDPWTGTLLSHRRERQQRYYVYKSDKPQPIPIPSFEKSLEILYMYTEYGANKGMGNTGKKYNHLPSNGMRRAILDIVRARGAKPLFLPIYATIKEVFDNGVFKASDSNAYWEELMQRGVTPSDLRAKHASVSAATAYPVIVDFVNALKSEDEAIIASIFFCAMLDENPENAEGFRKAFHAAAANIYPNFYVENNPGSLKRAAYFDYVGFVRSAGLLEDPAGVMKATKVNFV